MNSLTQTELTSSASPHSFELTVRDYEVDSYAGVNNATYLFYMEEARKHYLATLGFDLRALYQKNIGFVVSKYEIEYFRPLVAGNKITIETTMERLSRLKFRFNQTIYLLPEKILVVKASNIGIPINVLKNKPEWPAELNTLLAGFAVPDNN